MLKSIFQFLFVGLMVALPTEFALAQKSTLDVVKERGRVIVGVRKDLPYFGFVDEKGNVVGFEVDLVNGIAEKLGVKAELVVVTSATRMTLLSQARIDMVVASLSHYRSRDKLIDFSIGYFYGGQGLLVKKGSNIKSVADMAGKKVGTIVGTVTINNLKAVQPNVTTQTFEGHPESFLALQQGLVDALANDVLILTGIRTSAPRPNDFEVVAANSFGGAEWGIGFRENDSKWRKAIDDALQDMWLDGTWDKIFNKWVGPGTKLGFRKEDLGWKMKITPP